ncbi:hypothetical protein DFH08DRAFT_928165 [Mycena albidolilacea]|uniref:Uncharacterized protein n=1 Tax=Mycena albidolilacea TaxID=1033008 RepID=A0AAD7F3Q0_9AGAR|nr:hypothetical protein DFH08DRAFT_928165 [Mycena albidolilacea]
MPNWPIFLLFLRTLSSKPLTPSETRSRVSTDFLGVINISAAEAITAAANCTGHGDTITRDLTMSSNNLPVNGKFVFGFSFINQFPTSSPASAEPVPAPSGSSLTLVSISDSKLASRPSSSHSTNLAAPTVSRLDPRPSEPM